MLAGELSVVADHLLGRDDDANRRLETLLIDSLSNRLGDLGSTSFPPRAVGEGLVLTAVSLDDPSPYQLLAVVLLASRGRAPSRTAMRQVRSAWAKA